MAVPDVVINYLAVLVASIIVMALGFLWYSPFLFGKIWMKEFGMNTSKKANAKKKGMEKLYFLNLIATIVMTYILAHFMQYLTVETIADAFQAVFWIWLGFIATIQLGMVLWFNKSWKIYFINISYYLLALMLSAIVLLVWQ